MAPAQFWQSNVVTFIGSWKLLQALHPQLQFNCCPKCSYILRHCFPVDNICWMYLSVPYKMFLFCSCPATVLILPDHKQQFIVELDASDVVGSVLSQRFVMDNKVHPCDLFLTRLSPAESNYDVGNHWTVHPQAISGGLETLVKGVGEADLGLDLQQELRTQP